MESIVTIGNNDLQVKEWNGQRVVTFADIDRVHERPEGTAKRNFTTNKKHLLSGIDFVVIKPSDIQKDEIRTSGIEREDINNRGTTFLTESGYLLLVKSFTDDLAWDVQRKLVNTYFKFREVVESVHETENALVLPQTQFAEALDTLTTCAAIFQSMMEYSTINYKQQQELLRYARKRVNSLLGGAHSEAYKEYARVYFKNLWQDFCKTFGCGSYKDLNPIYMDSAKEYLNRWEYVE